MPFVEWFSLYPWIWNATFVVCVCTCAASCTDLCWSVPGPSTLLCWYLCLFLRKYHPSKYSNFMLCFAINWKNPIPFHLILGFFSLKLLFIIESLLVFTIHSCNCTDWGSLSPLHCQFGAIRKITVAYFIVTEPPPQQPDWIVLYTRNGNEHLKYIISSCKATLPHLSRGKVRLSG